MRYEWKLQGALSEAAGFASIASPLADHYSPKYCLRLDRSANCLKDYRKACNIVTPGRNMRTTNAKEQLPLMFILRSFLIMGAGYVAESFVTVALVRAQPHLLFSAFYWTALAASFALMVGGFWLHCKDLAYFDDYSREQRQAETSLDMAVLEEEDTRRQKGRSRGGAFVLAGYLTHISISRVYQQNEGWFFWSVVAASLILYIMGAILWQPLFQETTEKKKEREKVEEWKRKEKAELDAANAFIYGTAEKKE